MSSKNNEINDPHPKVKLLLSWRAGTLSPWVGKLVSSQQRVCRSPAWSPCTLPQPHLGGQSFFLANIYFLLIADLRLWGMLAGGFKDTCPWEMSRRISPTFLLQFLPFWSRRGRYFPWLLCAVRSAGVSSGSGCGSCPASLPDLVTPPFTCLRPC